MLLIFSIIFHYLQVDRISMIDVVHQVFELGRSSSNEGPHLLSIFVILLHISEMLGKLFTYPLQTLA